MDEGGEVAKSTRLPEDIWRKGYREKSRPRDLKETAGEGFLSMVEVVEGSESDLDRLLLLSSDDSGIVFSSGGSITRI
jgi:hypothetical protein